MKVRLKRIMSDQASVGAGAESPFPCMRRVQSTSSEMPTSTFFGSQPRCAHVPPKGRESITVTLHPASRHGYATLWAADPVPTTMRSTVMIRTRPDQRAHQIEDSSFGSAWRGPSPIARGHAP